MSESELIQQLQCSRDGQHDPHRLMSDEEIQHRRLEAALMVFARAKPIKISYVRCVVGYETKQHHFLP